MATALSVVKQAWPRAAAPQACLGACWLGVLALAALVSACSSTTVDKTESWSPNKIYTEAKDELASGAYDKAVVLYEKLEGRAAGTPLAQQAQLEKAYTQYKNNDQAQALATLDRFIKLHPASPAMDYALYLKGLVNFNDNLGIFSFLSRQDLSERDQKAAKESFESFKELVSRFPDSRYTPDARSRMTYIVNSLAQYEVHVARFYYSRGAYVAAVNRAQIAITDYPNVPAIEEALYIMVQSYQALGLTQLRDDTQRVMQANYPQSEFLSKGSKTAADPWWKFW
jgi:outer membrane protein assembly factor BamD